MTARAEWLGIAGDADAWRTIGLVVGDDGVVPLIGTALKIVAPTITDPQPPDTSAPEPPEDDRLGITGWALSGVDSSLDGTTIDGLTTTVVEPGPPVFASHAIGASGLDHVVVLTCDLLRTTGAIADATGCELKRVREVGTMKQGFHRFGRGGLIVEVVERPDVPDGPARFWGVVINVDDLDIACERVGADRISSPKDAVQPGRRIATISADAGLGLPVALMTS